MKEVCDWKTRSTQWAAYMHASTIAENQFEKLDWHGLLVMPN